MTSFPFVGVPIVQAPMAGAVTPELVAAVSNAGGLGSLPVGFTEPAQIGALIARVRALTDRPFAVNLFVDTALTVTDELLQRAHDRLRGVPRGAEASRTRPRRRSRCSISGPSSRPSRQPARRRSASPSACPTRRRWSAAGRPASTRSARPTRSRKRSRWSRPGSTRSARRASRPAATTAASRQPVEFSQIGTLALVPQVVDAVGVPVLAAGGLGDGRAVAAVLALGAAAAQVGSAFLRADESGIPAAFRRVLETEAARRTTMTTTFSGRTARGVHNAFMDAMAEVEDIAPYPYQHWLTRDIRNAAAAQDRAEYLSLWAGQAVALARPLPAAEIVAGLVAEARQAAEAARAPVGHCVTSVR